MAVVGRSASGIAFIITSYYFPLGPTAAAVVAAAAAAVVNVPLHLPIPWFCSYVSPSLSRIQPAFKAGRCWQGINPAGGISPSPTKLLLLPIECQSAFLALPDELLDAHYSKRKN